MIDFLWILKDIFTLLLLLFKILSNFPVKKYLKVFYTTIIKSVFNRWYINGNL